MEVDWAGETLKYKDPITKTIKKAYIFVSVLPASSYPFVRAYESMKLKNWIDAQIRAFEFYGGTLFQIIMWNITTTSTVFHTFMLTRWYPLGLLIPPLKSSWARSVYRPIP